MSARLLLTVPSPRRSSRRRSLYAVCLARAGLLSSLALFGCGGDVLPRRVTTRGFISEPLTVVDASSGLATFRREGARLEPGAAILLDAVSFWRPIEAPAGEIASEELEAVAYELREAIGAALERDFTIVRVPAPSALKLRLAIVEEASTWMVFEHLGTTRSPESRFEDGATLSPALQALLTKALFQVDFVSGRTGEGMEILAAGQIRAIPQRQPGTSRTWGEVRQGCLGIARLLRERLTQDGTVEASGGGDR